MLSLLSWCQPGKRKEKRLWKEIEEEAEHLDQHPSWDAPDNSLMLQAFEWHVPADQGHWRRLQHALPSFKAIGVDNIWIPPASKGMDPCGNGYDNYDLYDLGEFEQKGSRATKWGTKEELQSLAARAQEFGIGIYCDAVLNHKAGADYTERFPAARVDPQERNTEISSPEEIEGWVGFNFPGRGDRYSSMMYNQHHFSGVDWDQKHQKSGVYKLDGHDWAKDVARENGNYDYLMFADLDYSNNEVRNDVLNWGEWINTQLPLSGMRLDAAKHYSAGFQKEFIDHLRATVRPDYFIVGEYWESKTKPLLDYLEQMDYKLSLFDSALVRRLSSISRVEGADLRNILNNTLVQLRPEHAVTFVTNHDTQPGQSLAAPVASRFKALAYALILLHDKGQPCVFYGDLYGLQADVRDPMTPSCKGKLPKLTQARKLYAYGLQRDYFDKPTCIGFVRYGNRRHPSGLVCIMSNAGPSRKRMYVGRRHSTEQWTDILQWYPGTVVIDKKGYGEFPVSAMSVSVWVNSSAEGRDSLQYEFDKDIYKY
ncbi:glycoside hydrolase family 13 protein [Aspergillus carbonarius ITEM 5010]|uniref:Glycoside hydrolase family 13 protein n=1 Tax=Aspergillus carbonarius (strain ITEM 5010) TaxID=602072 RepID=A0A1R3RLX8_ASPC5|nr:glycoside hydrolase family 13 protein [Aspergillus carbonarius ITEM 5010]